MKGIINTTKFIMYPIINIDILKKNQKNLDCHQTQFKITNINDYKYVHVYFKAIIYK
jgi:hypothetical protein